MDTPPWLSPGAFFHGKEILEIQESPSRMQYDLYLADTNGHHSWQVLSYQQVENLRGPEIPFPKIPKPNDQGVLDYLATIARKAVS
jgi:hypothetical protein